MLHKFCPILFPLLCVIAACSSPPYSVDRGRLVPEDFFGIAAYRTALEAEDFALLDDLGVVWQRRTCRWSSLESRPGAWDFSDWDNYVEDSLAAGKKLLAILAYDTPWLYEKKNAPCAIGPKELLRYLAYVEKVVSRYRGKIGAYEIWNEPNMLKWEGSQEDFFTMTLVAAKKIREIDPHALILAGSFWRVPESYIRRLFKSGVMDYVDAISFHPYAVNPKGAVQLYAKLEKLLAGLDYRGEVWVTEVGYPTGGWYPTWVREEHFPRYIIKTLAGLAVRNIRVMLWYELKDTYPRGQAPVLDSECFFGITDLERKPKNGYHAWALCGRYLAGAEYRPAFPRRERLPAGIVSLYFSKNGQGILILWNERGGTYKAKLALPGTEQILHNISTREQSPLSFLSTVAITENPLFITWQEDAAGNGPVLSKN